MTLGEAMKAWRESFNPPLTIPQAAAEAAAMAAAEAAANTAAESTTNQELEARIAALFEAQKDTHE